MSRKPLFQCAECGGSVFDAVGPGRTAEYRRGVELPVPPDFAIPTCASCGETYFTVQRGERLAKLQKPAFELWLKSHAAELIGLLLERHAISLRQLETACGFTATYFSHVIHGSKTPSLQLVRQLEAYDACPRELQRLLEGRVWKPADVAASIFATPVMHAALASVEHGRVEITAGIPAAYEGATFELGSASNDKRTAA